MRRDRTKIAIRLIGGLADGFVFTLPAESVPPFIGVGPVARYQRVAGNGEVICYRFADSGPFGPN
jgi:hypothetical protein